MSAVPKRVIELVDARDKYTDGWTGQTIGPGRNLHHRKLRSRGGGHTAANLISMSGSGTTGSHGHVHSKVGLATALGFIVPSWAEPHEVPILLGRPLAPPVWTLLNLDGTTTPLTNDRALWIHHALGIATR